MCSIDYADGYSTLLQRTYRTARKDHRCGECHRVIKKGEEYLYEVLVYDGIGSYKTCSHCEIVREWLNDNCGGFVWTEIYEDIEEHCYPGMPLGLYKFAAGMRRKWTSIKGTLMPLPKPLGVLHA